MVLNREDAAVAEGAPEKTAVADASDSDSEDDAPELGALPGPGRRAARHGGRDARERTAG
jgi:hypothetical protein